jgi:LacI family transcriptional regulator
MAQRKVSRSVTLSDVAQVAGVATMTVSRFLNHHPNISEKTGKKIRSAIKQLGYSPNLAARMLKGQPSNTIGLIVPSLSDCFFAEVAHNVQNAARDRGLLVWVAASNSDQANDIALIEQMKQHSVDGILLIPSPGKLPFDWKSGLPPIVMLDRPVYGSGCDSVIVDNRRASAEAVEHLIAHGYKQIAYISCNPADVYTNRERAAGYKDAMQAGHLRPTIGADKRTAAEIREFLMHSFARSRSLDAIFAANNVATVHTLEALSTMGLSVPNDVALVGFDDFALAPLVRPSLSVVRQPAADLGRRAASVLFDRMDHQEQTQPITLALQTTFIARDSCGCGASYRKNKNIHLQQTLLLAPARQ